LEPEAGKDKMYAASRKPMPQQPTTGEITHLLAEWAAGRPEPAPELWETVYRELRRVATAYVRNQRPNDSLQATALINEAYIRIFQGTPSRWENRKHFFCAMARIMRQVMIDHARQCHAQKRGGEWQRVPLEKFIPTTNDQVEDLLFLHEALAELGELNPRQAQIVELRYFAGLTRAQTAAILNISPETVKLDSNFAKAWLKRKLRHSG
jgi:RNA polymerase sigma-70 factor, ECF subfamily